MADSSSTVGKVQALAVRSVHLGTMKELEEVEAAADGCLEGDHGSRARRGITLLSSRQWRLVLDELDADLPWHTRRANVLIDADTLVHLIGSAIRIGPVLVRIHQETDPCNEMDQLFPGLRRALTPDCRGGVYGQIVEGGRIRVGDLVSIDPPEAESSG